jgi:cytochrome c-type biogenesis protein CcmH/NrfF
MRFSILLLMALAPLWPADLNPEQQQRAHKIETSLLAPCCWSEPVSTHRSEISLSIKAEIEKLVGEGKTDREVLDLYKSRYGMRILVEPEGSQWWVMNVVPVVMTVLGLMVVVFVIRRMLRPLPASSQ